MSASSMNGEDALPSETESENSLRVYETLGAFLKNDNWHPQEIAGTYSYRTLITSSNGDFRGDVRVRVEQQQLVFYVYMGAKIPEERRPAAAEFLTRANYGLPLGNFELDFEDGEVRFKNSVSFMDDTLSENLIRSALYPALSVAPDYFQGLLKVAFGGEEPRAAIQEIEG